MDRTTASLDNDLNQAGYEAVQPHIQAILPEQLIAARGVDLGLAAIRLLQLGLRFEEKKLNARFARLPADEFDAGVLDLWVPSARAVLYLLPLVRTEAAAQGQARLPMDLVTQAVAVRDRMLRLCEYHFGDDPVLGPEVADIRSGVGYLDLGLDLMRLGRIYATQRAAVAADTKHYRKDDAALAAALASRIQEELDKDPNAALATRTRELNQAWTLLVRTYLEIRAAALFLFRNDAEELARWALPYSLGREASTSKGTADDDSPAPATPAAPA